RMSLRLAGIALAALIAGALPALARSKSPEPGTAVETAIDLAYGAFQRGEYLTAYAEATRRIEQDNDPKAMTLVGELLAHGLGVKRDEARAAYWYRRAASAGDREAIFALGLMYLEGRGVERDRAEAARRFRAAADLGQPMAAY